MQYTPLLLASLLSTSTLAAPWGSSSPSTDTTVRITLSNQATETGAQVVLPSEKLSSAVPATSGPFQTVELSLGAGVQQRDLRCQALDAAGNPLVVLRGANTDITFGDGDKGEWTFREPSLVSNVVCDPAFVKGPADAAEIRVVLSNQATETGSQTVFADEGERQYKAPVGSTGPFQTVELRVGALVQKQDQRCQVVDKMGMPIVVLRGENRDVTFSDAGKGEWTFETESEVGRIVCDPAFVATRV